MGVRQGRGDMREDERRKSKKQRVRERSEEIMINHKQSFALSLLTNYLRGNFLPSPAGLLSLVKSSSKTHMSEVQL